MKASRNRTKTTQLSWISYSWRNPKSQSSRALPCEWKIHIHGRIARPWCFLPPKRRKITRSFRSEKSFAYWNEHDAITHCVFIFCDWIFVWIWTKEQQFGGVVLCNSLRRVDFFVVQFHLQFRQKFIDFGVLLDAFTLGVSIVCG